MGKVFPPITLRAQARGEIQGINGSSTVDYCPLPIDPRPRSEDIMECLAGPHLETKPGLGDTCYLQPHGLEGPGWIVAKAMASQGFSSRVTGA